MARLRIPKLACGAVLSLALIAGACSDGDESSGPDREEPSEVAFEGTIDLEVEPVAGCDLLQERHCMLPFPSDAFTVEDTSTDTGRRVAFREENMPVNSEDVRIDPAEWNRNDGFSPGTPIMAWIPTVDLEASGAAPITDIGRSLEDDSPVVIIDTETGERHPHWVEFDENATSDLTKLLMIRPAVNFTEGHRYVVALRSLRDRGGETIEPDDVFRAYRDRLESDVPEVEERRADMEEIFSVLEDAGVPRGDLWLAWDFTVASERNLTERILTIRDEAFDELGADAPAFEVDEVVEPTGDEAENVAYYVHGTFDVPLYLTGEGESGSSFNWGDDDLPTRNTEHPDYTASFMCTVPRSAVEPDADPARAVVYGHGLLGSRTEVDAGNIQLMTAEHDMVYCATDWIGMAEDDLANVIGILGDLSGFHTMADRSQQGILNTLFLGRLMIHPDGLISDPAFQVDGRPILDTSDLFFDSNSQGAIMGGAATAVSLDWTRAVLGVPGMNYSTLLNRSVDFDTYAAVLAPAYTDELERAIGYGVIQMLWDRAETNGYANHLTDDPLPGTPEHTLLLHVAFGDFQVADVTAFVEARTMGAAYRDPILADGRGQIDYLWGLDPIDSYPWPGSAVVMWDSGVPAPPLGNVPPTGEGDPQGAHDPHEDPRMMPNAREQKSEFLTTDGVVIDVCDGAPCESGRVD